MHKIRVGINGLGRIGKLVFRLLLQHPDIQIVGINDPMTSDMLAYLLRYDTVHGKLNFKIEINNDLMLIDNNTIYIGHFTQPEQIPWSKWGVDMVIEASGLFKIKAQLEKHISSGAKKVILTCPPDDELDRMIILGVNDSTLTPKDQIISNASCTANCVAPMLKVLDEEFGVESAYMNTVHPYTNNQNLLDAPHSDYRRARSAAANIIPTSSTAVRAIYAVMPQLINRFTGIATRVPLPDGALTELVVHFKNDVSESTINQAMQKHSESTMKGVLEYCADPIVSSDIINNSHSCIFDALSTKVLGNRSAQIIGWYDNEYGYSNRIVNLLERLVAFENS